MSAGIYFFFDTALLHSVDNECYQLYHVSVTGSGNTELLCGGSL